MQVVVLMGGRGERLSGITAGLSKAMVDIQGEPAYKNNTNAFSVTFEFSENVTGFTDDFNPRLGLE